MGWVAGGRRERATGGGLLVGVAVVAALVVGCNPAPVPVATKRLAPVAPNEITRIAVLPFSEVTLRRETGTEPFPEPAGDTVTRAVADEMRIWPDWRITDDIVTAEASRQLYGEARAPTPEEAVAVGRLLNVDAVLRGQVTEFRELIGTGFAAQRPARVVFAVELVRIPSGVGVWQAEYAETQEALSDNLWNVFGFVRAGGRWVRAGELARLGARQVVDQLHEALFGPKRRPKKS